MAIAEPVVKGRFQLSSFRESWKHCSQTSNYLAKLIVDQLPDAYYLYSAVINELLEVAYRDAGADGCLEVSAALVDDEVRLEIAVPAASMLGATWAAYVAAGNTPEGVAHSYLGCLESDEVHPALGLLQITTDYGVSLTLDERDGGVKVLKATIGRMHA